MLTPLKPDTYRISRGFGPSAGSFHRGVDFAAPMNTRFHAAEDGLVVDSRDRVGGFGCWIVIDHSINGKKVSTVYGHMYKSGLKVVKGQRVNRGQFIGLVGSNGQSTGPHLHFEVWVGGRFTPGTAVDPMPWLTNEPVLPVLSIGDSGASVLNLQNFMTRVFYTYNNYRPTGFFGPLTEAGVMEFQRRTGLVPDGVVGYATNEMLAKYGYK